MPQLFPTRLLIAALPLLMGSTAWAQPTAAAAIVEDPTPVRAFRTFSRGAAARELPQSTVVALHEDTQGVIWIATLDGVARVDRGTVERLPAVPGAPLSGPFYAIADRHAGGVHFAGNDAIYTWDRGAWARSPTPLPVISIAEDTSGRLYAVDRRGAIWTRATGTEWTQVPEQGDPFGFVVLSTGRDGRVVAGGRRGAVELSGGAISAVVGGGPPAAPVTALRVHTSGSVWAGGDDGRLYAARADTREWRPVDLPQWDGGRIRSLGEDRRGRVWAGGDRGYVAFGSEGGPFRVWTPQNGLKRATVTTILGDRTGSVWFGYNAVGLQQWLGEAWSHRPYWTDLSDTDAVNAFSITPTADDGYLAAVFSRGVWKWDGTRMRRYGRDEGITEDVRFAAEPEPGVIWAGARFGMFESRDGGPFRKVLAIPSGFVNGMFRAPDGRWWIATSTMGVLVREGAEWKPLDEVNKGLPDPNVRHVVWRSNGETWIATGRGVVVVPLGGGAPRPQQLPAVPTFAYALLEKGVDEMWVAGAGGIAVFRDGQWRTLTQEDGLPGATVYAMAAGLDGSVWAGGSSGVGHFDGQSWTVYDSSDGLIAEECNAHGLHVARNGDVLVGTMSGLARYSAELPPLPDPSLRLFWRDAALARGDRLDIGSADRRLLLQWTAPWPRPVNVEFRTRIPGLDTDWSPPQSMPELRVENLAAGHWRVEVAARLPAAGGRGWTEPIVANVRILPRPWETLWARSAVLIAGALLVAAVVQWRTRQLKRRAEELERAVNEAVGRVKVLRGLLPICAHCKKIRDDHGYWRRIEDYIGQHSEADFSHGFCPECIAHHYPDFVRDDDVRHT